MTDVNIPLLRKAVEWAEAEAAKPPELCEWEQKFWRIPADTPWGFAQNYRANRAPECGTTYCIAGYVCEAIGATERAVNGDAGFSEIAGDALGLSELAADDLFAANNTIADIRRIAEDLAGERL